MNQKSKSQKRKIIKPNWDKYGYKWAIDDSDARCRAENAKTKGRDDLDGELITAIRYRDLIYANALLAVGANPNSVDGNRASVLGHAIESGSLESVNLLLKYGADPNLKTGLATPLTNCIFEEKWDLAKCLLQAGANVNAIGAIRSTALHVLVSYSSNIELGELLVEHGADIEARDAEGRTPLEAAKRARRRRMVEFLEKVAKPKRTRTKARLIQTKKNP